MSDDSLMSASTASHLRQWESLLPQTAGAIRAQRFPVKPRTETEDRDLRWQIARDVGRMNELAACLREAEAPDPIVEASLYGDPVLMPWDVDEHIERWIVKHPLGLTGLGLKRVIDESTGGGNGVSVALQIGDPADGGRYYQLHEGQFAVAYGGSLLLSLPDSVAEEFRQQGIRRLRRDLAEMLGFPSRNGGSTAPGTQPSGERVLVSDLHLGDVVTIEDQTGKVTMLDTYNLGGRGGAAPMEGGDGTWPCVRIFIDWATGSRGYARFPSEYVWRVSAAGD